MEKQQNRKREANRKRKKRKRGKEKREKQEEKKRKNRAGERQRGRKGKGKEDERKEREVEEEEELYTSLSIPREAMTSCVSSPPSCPKRRKHGLPTTSAVKPHNTDWGNWAANFYFFFPSSN